MKRLAFLLFVLLLLAPTLVPGENLYEAQLDRGIRNSEPYSYLLIKKSIADKTMAKAILQEALRYSPDFPATYFELSGNSFNFSPKGIFEAIDYIREGISAYERNFWWSYTLIASLFMSLVLSFIVSIFVLIVVRLPLDMPLLYHDIKEGKIYIFILLLIVLVLAALGPLYLLGGLLVVVSLYGRRWSKFTAAVYIVFLLVAPWIFGLASLILNAPASGELKAVVQVNESAGNRYALSVLKDCSDPVELFSYALALKREGSYREAIEVYNKLISKRPDSRAYNNLADCYVAINDMKMAKELYIKANELKQSPATLYNLSRVYRETFDFDKGEKYFLAAQKLNNSAVSQFGAIFSRNPNRFVVDETLPFSDMSDYAREKTARTFTLRLSIVPPLFMPAIGLFLAAIFVIFNKILRSRAYRCSKCGNIICTRCEKRILWGHMCRQCYRSLVKLDELDAKERIARLLRVYDYQKRRRDIIKVISFVLPGSGQIYAGDIPRGLLLLWLFLFFIFVPIMNSLFVMDMSDLSHLWLNLSSLFLMAVTYIVSAMIAKRRLAKGWL
jgi:tetratricopeptide (TPR) repeat protein